MASVFFGLVVGMRIWSCFVIDSRWRRQASHFRWVRGERKEESAIHIQNALSSSLHNPSKPLFAKPSNALHGHHVCC